MTFNYHMEEEQNEPIFPTKEELEKSLNLLNNAIERDETHILWAILDTEGRTLHLSDHSLNRYNMNCQVQYERDEESSRWILSPVEITTKEK